MRAPRRSSTALVPTVVPCSSRTTLAGARPTSRSMRATPRTTPSTGSSRLEGSLVQAIRRRPSFLNRQQTSVKVPPISTAMIVMLRSSPLAATALQELTEGGHHDRQHDQPRRDRGDGRVHAELQGKEHAPRQRGAGTRGDEI